MAGWVDMAGSSLTPKNGIFLSTFGRTRPDLVIFLALAGLGCGLPGGTSISNDTVPSSATYLTGGSLTGSGTVTGTAQVYQSGSTVLLHLEGLVSPVGTAYAVFLENGSPSAPFYFSQLKSIQGNQNYFTGRAVPTVHFNRVAIRVTTSTSSTEMASATLAAY